MMDIIHIILVTCISIFVIQMIMSIFGTSFEFETDMDVDDIISFKGILHFFLGFSIYVTVMNEINFINILGGIITGVIFTYTLYRIYKLIYKVSSEKIRESYSDLVGRECEIYVNLGEGQYIAYVSINGAQEKIEVKSLSKDNTFVNCSKQLITTYNDKTKTIYIK